MATAREQLQEEILALGEAQDPNKEQKVSVILDRYRLQLKDPKAAPQGLTARDAIGQEIGSAFSAPAKDFKKKIAEVIDRYRMQLKQAVFSVSEKGAIPKAPKKEPSVPKKKTSIPSPKKGSQVPKKKQARSEPVGGGPQKRGGSRGQCPKCHSLGVVLARSFANDEYYSCIYCGFQAYRATLDADLDLPLAAELLTRRFDDKENV